MLEFFVRRPVATTMIYAAVLLLGGISLSRLKVSLFPDIVFPKLTVLTPYSNVAPEEIENLVTRPIEDAVSSVSGVKKIVSRSQEGLSIVEVSLEWGTSLDLAIINVRQKVDLARATLPQDTGKPIIVKFDPASDPVVTLVARPVNLTFEELRDYIDKNVRPFFERIEGVASVSILGGMKREIQIRVDSRKMYGFGLSLQEISQALSAANFNYPAGNVRRGDREYTVRIEGHFGSTDEIENVVVGGSDSGVPIYLHQVAEVVDSHKDRKGSSYYNGEPAVIVGIKKEPEKNTVETAQSIRESLEGINKRFERNVEFSVIHDNSLYITDAIASVRNAALLGGAIAFLVLFLFLHDIKASVIIALSIPVSIVNTFVLMYLRDISLNIMSLGGLALGTGMLVDNAIVVLESIFFEREARPGLSAAEAAVEGTRKVAGSVMASTFTSIVVFVPIIFVSGVAGEVFRDLAFTVSFSLLSSLVSSVSLIPMLASLDPSPGSLLQRLFAGINRYSEPLFELADDLVSFIKRRYLKVLGYSFAHPRRILSVSFALAAVGILLFLPIDRSLFPDVDQGVVYGEFELSGGTTIEDSERLHKRIHDFITKNGLAVHTVSAIGYDEDDLTSLVKGVRKGNYSENNFYIDRSALSSREFIEIMNEGLAGTEMKRNFRIKGDALQDLLGDSGVRYILVVESRERDLARRITGRVYSEIRETPFFRSLSSSSQARDPEIHVTLDRQKISSYGLNPESVAGTIRTAVHGTVPTIYREGDREVDIRVRLRDTDRERIQQLFDLYVPVQQSTSIELGTLIRLKEDLGHSTILRENQRRLEQVVVEYKEGYEEETLELLTKKAAAAVQVEAANLPGDEKPEFRVKQANEETLESLKNLLFAFILSSVLIYQLLAAQFESLLHPFTLALSIPLMLFGVSSALLLTGHSLNIASAIGMILLVGIVVNSAIVLYEYIQYNREQKLKETGDPEAERATLAETISVSAEARVRPILLTTLTTLLGMIPMAVGIGSGGSLQAPMAVVVIGGLTVSSVLTLVAFPTMYLVMERWAHRK